MNTEQRIEQAITIAALSLLLAGCFVVIRPFLSSVMWAAILCYSTWPIAKMILRVTGGRQSLAAFLMTLLLALLFVGPLTTAGFLMADNAKQAYQRLSILLQNGLPDPPEWLDRIPVIGDNLVDYWMQVAEDNSQLIVMLKTWAGNSRTWLISSGVSVGEVALQLILSLFIAFFFYRDGVWFLERLRGAIMRITRDRTQHILDLVGNTIKGVIYGIVGTALAQSLIAGLGFWIAGVPMPFLLGLFTFFAALIPMGPPFIWIPASIWLFMNDHMGWGIFMIIYGALGISSIDNILRPYLISYSSKMPFIIVFLGALGGAIGFGFLGVFLGPALLAVGFSLLKDWGNLTAKTALSGSDKIAKSLDKGSSNTVT